MVCEVIFGIPDTNNPDIKLLIFLILMEKWFINKCKSNETPTYFFKFLDDFKKQSEYNDLYTHGRGPGCVTLAMRSTQCSVKI